MASLLTISIRLLPSEATAPNRSGAAVGACGRDGVAGNDRVMERGRARLDIQAAAVVRLVARDRATEHVHDPRGIDAAAVARCRVGGDGRVGEGQHTEVLNASAVAGRRAVAATVTPVRLNTPSFKIPPPVLARPFLDRQVVEEQVGPLGDLEYPVGPATARINPGAAEASIVTFREIKSSLLKVIVRPARDEAKEIGVP